MKRHIIVLLITILLSVLNFAVIFEINTTEQIHKDILQFQNPTILPTVTVNIKPIYSSENFSIITNIFERYNFGTLTINSPLMINHMFGFSSCWATEYIGNIYPFEDYDSSICYCPCCTPQKCYYDRKYCREDSDEDDDIYSLRNDFTKTSGTSFEYIHIKNIRLEDENDSDNRNERCDNKCGNCEPSIIQLGNIDSENVLLVFSNPCCRDIIYINSITAKRVWIYNAGCRVFIGKIHSTCKIFIKNLCYSMIEIGNSPCQEYVDAQLNVQLSYDQDKFGLISSDNNFVIDNTEKVRIKYKWENAPTYKTFPEYGFVEYYTDQNQLKIMKTKTEKLLLKIDVSDEWYKFPAGEYSSTLYFTIESL